VKTAKGIVFYPAAAVLKAAYFVNVTKKTWQKQQNGEKRKKGWILST